MKFSSVHISLVHIFINLHFLGSNAKVLRVQLVRQDFWAKLLGKTKKKKLNKNSTMKISSLNNRESWQSLTKQNTCVFEDFLLEHCFLEHLSIDISLIRQIMNLNSRLKFKTSFLTDILLIIMRQNITHISPKDHVLSIWSSCSFLAFMGHDPRIKSAWFEETLFAIAERTHAPGPL